MQLMEQQRRDRLGRVLELNLEDSQVTHLCFLHLYLTIAKIKSN